MEKTMNVTISVYPWTKYIFDKMRNPLPLSTYLQFLAYLWFKNTAQFQYLNEKMGHEFAREEELKKMKDFAVEFEQILKDKGRIIEEETEEIVEEPEEEE